MSRPTLAVWKFASCDGCQLQILSVEEELLALTDEVQIAYFPEATRGEVSGPYDLSLVEGSITTPHDVDRIHEIRAQTKTLVTIGACATAGGIQALRNHADVREYVALVYAHPEYIQTLETSTAIAEHVPVDLELRGCPIEVGQLLDVVSAYLAGRPPRVSTAAVCLECKLRDNVCVTVAEGVPCLGPVTQAGCGSRCPAVGRGCYGCFGPMETPNTASLSEWAEHELGLTDPQLMRLFRTFNAGAPAFRDAATAREADVS